MKTSREIRQDFLNFFKEKMHLVVPSAPVVPFDDPTLLFTNAGMNQFKDVFLGKGQREFNRIVNTQKCIRVSGKHNDLEEVGYDTYHHTFFEMLGNWSFGDPHAIDGVGTGYYKEEAIKWAWELLTEVWKLPKERLYATVYKTDDEAFNCWKTSTDIDPSHILRFGEKDNFWEMGDVGPCGPCSEIHINLSDNFNDPSLVNAGSPECIEIWNLVFIQYNRLPDGKLELLRAKHVDTGMGFERICAVIQGKKSNYDTDIFTPLIEKIVSITGQKYEGEKNKVAIRVIADHIRALTFAIADGAFPSNEGRGYVLRRILRRASRFARNLGVHEPILYKLVETLTETMGDVFPEIVTHKKHIEEIIKGEEESFGVTLDKGIEIFQNITENLKKTGEKIISGEDAFKLYDTYGFPIDLTNLMAREIGFSVDTEKFEMLMEEQRQRSRDAGKFQAQELNFSVSEKELKPTEFLGYKEFEAEANIIYQKDNLLVLDKTPFYAEAGGQVGDKGYVIQGGKSLFVEDTQPDGNVFVHKLNENILLDVEKPVLAKIDVLRRKSIMRNHSATHLLHKALRMVLGEHVKQAGSLVDEDRLRFDFTHFRKLEKEEIKEIETIVNTKIREALPLYHHLAIPFDEAKKMGALMFFGEKYGEKVNVVQFGDFSMEFCGGTHVKNTAEIGLLKVFSEFSISSGVRRIEAVTGEGIERFIEQKIAAIDELNKKYEMLFEEKKNLEKELNKLKIENLKANLKEIVNNAKILDENIQIAAGKIKVESMDQLKQLGDELRHLLKYGVGILVSIIENKVAIVCVVTDNLIKEKNLNAGKIVGELAKIVGGGGGGRPHLATSGGKDVNKVDELFAKLPSIVESFLRK